MVEPAGHAEARSATASTRPGWAPPAMPTVRAYGLPEEAVMPLPLLLPGSAAPTLVNVRAKRRTRTAR